MPAWLEGAEPSQTSLLRQAPPTRLGAGEAIGKIRLARCFRSRAAEMDIIDHFTTLLFRAFTQYDN
jgi:hypothetical protein